ncbi:MAG: ShlB/FhaC/HecB family hemolysin secretion/activation protein [Magnetococcales bacterium]|nr:ShlB/FhaC/HecB family hemolysin secretion/activation protein [Magnetococcales bacterium]
MLIGLRISTLLIIVHIFLLVHPGLFNSAHANDGGRFASSSKTTSTTREIPEEAELFADDSRLREVNIKFCGIEISGYTGTAVKRLPKKNLEMLFGKHFNDSSKLQPEKKCLATQNNKETLNLISDDGNVRSVQLSSVIDFVKCITMILRNEQDPKKDKCVFNNEALDHRSGQSDQTSREAKKNSESSQSDTHLGGHGHSSGSRNDDQVHNEDKKSIFFDFFFSNKDANNYFLSRMSFLPNSLDIIDTNDNGTQKFADNNAKPVKVHLVIGKVGDIEISSSSSNKEERASLVKTVIDSFNQVSTSDISIDNPEIVTRLAIQLIIKFLTENERTDQFVKIIFENVMNMEPGNDNFKELINMYEENRFNSDTIRQAHFIELINRLVTKDNHAAIKRILESMKKNNIQVGDDVIRANSHLEMIANNKQNKRNEPYKCYTASNNRKIEEKICEVLRPLREENPLSRLTLDRTLSMANKLPGIDVEAVLTPPLKDGKPNTGNTTEMTVNWKLRRIEWTTGADNSGSEAMGPVIGWNRLDVNYVATPGDQLSWMFAGIPDEELSYNKLGYLFPIGHAGYYSRIGVSTDNANLGGTFRPLDVIVDDHQEEIAFGLNIPRDRYSQMKIETGLHFTNVDSMLGGRIFAHDEVARAFLGGSFDRQRNIIELQDEDNALPGTYNLGIRTEISHGLRLHGMYSEDRSAMTSRPEAGPDFTKINFEVNLLREFSKSFSDKNTRKLWPSIVNFLTQKSTNRFYIAADSIAQYATQPLLSSEEVAYGGRMFASAYETGKISGDSGIALRGKFGWKVLLALENRSPYTMCNPLLMQCNAENDPEFASHLMHRFQLEPFAFTEYAQTWNRDLESQRLGTENEYLLSGGSGLGVSWQPDQKPRYEKCKERDKDCSPILPIEQISSQLSLAWPLNDSMADPDSDRPEFRWSFALQFFVPDF